MKLFIIPSWYPSRISPANGAFYFNWARMFSDAGYDVTVVANLLHSLKKFINYSKLGYRFGTPPEDAEIRTVRHESINMFPGLRAASYRSYKRQSLALLHRAINEIGKPDVVLIHSSIWAGAALSAELNRLNIPFALAEHAKEFLMSDGWSPYHRRLIAKSYGCADKIIANSSAVERSILADYQTAVGKTAVIYNAIDAPTVGALPRPSVADEFRFIAVAFLRTEKRLAMLLESFAEFLKTNPNSHMTIVGGGPLHNDLERQIERLGLTDHAYLTGYLPPDRVQEEIAKSHALVLPSDVETFGLALVEAMTHGLPVIATRCGGPEDIVTDETGLLIPTDDAEALTSAMGEMLREYRRFKGVAIREYAADKFGPQKYVAAFQEVFDEIKRKNFP